MPTKTVEFRSVIKTTPEAMFAFHSAPGAFAKLTPPPVFIQVLRDDRASFTEGEIEFRMWVAFIPVHWVARHEPGPIATSFIDRLLAGPLASWEHHHIFQAVDGGTELIDRITFMHKAGLAGLLTRLFFDGLSLRFLFAYRHWRTRRALT